MLHYDELSVADLQILDDALFHRLGLACGIRQQENQGDGFQVFNFGLGSCRRSWRLYFLSLEATIKLLPPCDEEGRRDPVFLVRFV